MNAAEARSIAEQKNVSLESGSMAIAIAAIKKAAGAGDSSVNIYGRIAWATKEKLKADGYQIRDWDDHDQRDGSGCSVTW